MNLELSTRKEQVSIHQPEQLKEEDTKLVAYSGRAWGEFSNTVSIEFRNKKDEEAEEAWVSMNLNRNQARYLRDFLTSFLHEEKINIEAED